MRPKDQGTRWETAVVRKAQDLGLLADRLPEGGPHDAGDLWIGGPLVKGDPYPAIPVLAWKRLTGDGQRRTPDGVAHVAVLDLDDFLELYAAAVDGGLENPLVVEAKARQTLNVTRTLANTIHKYREWKRR